MSKAEGPPLRILYVLAGYGDEHLGGSIHTEMARAIRSRGHDYRLFAPSHARDMGARAAEAVEDGVPIHRAVCAGRPALDLLNAAARPVFRFPWFAALCSRLRRFLRTQPVFDVIIAEGAYPLGLATAWAARRSPPHLVVSVLGADFLANHEANYGYARYALPRALMGNTFRRAAIVRAISPYAGERAVRLGCPYAKLALVPRNVAACTFLPEGVPREAFRRDARERVSARFGLGTERLVVSVGRLLPIKGFDVLVRALPAIEASARVRLLHVGPNRIDSRLGDYQRYLEGLGRALDVAGRMTFTGGVPLEQVRDLLAAADVAVVPSLEEGGNKTLIEAAAVGTPFVVTRTSGNAEWAKEWDAGLIVEPRSADALSRAVSMLLGDTVRADAMGANGVRFAAHFATDRVAERMLALCRCAATRKPLPADLREPHDLLHPEHAVSQAGR
jgi:glycosyltransferase involved in cell wall biosynthesis